MKLFLSTILIFTVASFGSQALGQVSSSSVISLTNTGPDDNFDNGLNFTTAIGSGTVPGPGSSLYIFPGFTTFPNSTNTLILVQVGGALTVTLNAPGNESVDNLAVSGYFEGTNATAQTTLNLTIQNSGTLTVIGDEVVTGGTIVNFAGNERIFGTLQVGASTSDIDPAQITGSGTLNLGAGNVNLDLGTGGTVPTTTSIIVGSGVNGTLTQGASSTVTTGNVLTIGTNGGTGVYTLGTGSTLNIGTQGAPISTVGYNVTLGSVTGSTGTLNIASGVVVSAANATTSIIVGNAGVGIVNQAGTLNLGGATGSSLTVAAGGPGSNGTYNLSGALNLGANGTDAVNFTMGTLLGGVANFNQTAGSFVAGANTVVVIGKAGEATYNLSGGTADFENGFGLGQLANSVGAIVQTGGTLTAENTAFIGGNGAGEYILSGSGTATFTGGFVVNAFGTVIQSGGVLTTNTLNLSAFGAAYNLNGGTLKLDNTALVGTTGEGLLNFGGGTLQITTAGAFTNALDGRLSGNSSLIDATTAGVAVTDVTMSGTLTGTGGINFQGTAGAGGTTFNLTGPNTYTGSTGIISGTLNVAAANIMDSSALNVGNTGTLTLDLTASTGGLAYGGTIGSIGAGGNGGLFQVAFGANSTFALLGNNGFTGTISLGSNGTAGNLQLYSGSYNTIAAPAAPGSTVTIGGPITTANAPAFPVGVTAPASGAVSILNGTYTGLTTVNTGFTLRVGTLAGGLTSTSGSTLSTFGTTDAPANANVGSLATTATAGANATIIINTDGALADKFVVTGAADVSNTKFRVSGLGSNTYDIVTGTTVTSTGATAVGGGALFSATLDNLGTGTLELITNQLQISQAVSAGVVPSLTHNEAAVAGALDPVIGAQPPYPPSFVHVLQTLNNYSGSQIPGALDLLSPEPLQYARNIAFENSTFLAQRVNGIDADIRNGFSGLDTNAISVVSPGFESGMGRSLGSLLAYNDPGFHNAAPNGVNYYPGEAGRSSPSPVSESPEPATFDSSSQVISDSPNPYLADVHPGGAETPVVGEFISGDVVLADLNKDSSASDAAPGKASYTAGDVTAGVSFRVTNHFAAGVLFDYNHTDADTDANGSKTKVDSYSPGIYATYFDKGFYANGLFSFGYNSYTNDRETGFGDAQSRPDGQQYVGDLDFGYDFHPDKHWVVGPTLGATYTHLDIDSFTEVGAPGANLAVQDQSVDSVRSRLGGHMIYQTNAGDVLLQPNLTAMWQHEFLADSSGITSSFNDFGSSSFTINTAAPSRDSALIGLGLTATLNNSMAFYLNYLADVGASNYFAQSVIGGFKARF